MLQRGAGAPELASAAACQCSRARAKAVQGLMLICVAHAQEQVLGSKAGGYLGSCKDKDYCKSHCGDMRRGGLRLYSESTSGLTKGQLKSSSFLNGSSSRLPGALHSECHPLTETGASTDSVPLLFAQVPPEYH